MRAEVGEKTQDVWLIDWNNPEHFIEPFFSTMQLLMARREREAARGRMKAIVPGAVFIGFTGTPLLKADEQKSIEVFGRYIHTGPRRILLNLELAKKPVQCLEYIGVHELAHLIERHHNDRFVALMDQHLPHWRR